MEHQMQKSIIALPAIKLVGITVRTNNKTEVEPHTGKILPCIQRYFHGSIAETIPKRKKPGTTYCVYTEYESDFTGDYTYFIGEAVNDFEALPQNLEKHIIPAQTYSKFTNGPGVMPNVVREPWQKIWQMSSADLGGDRGYLSDFEIYDERAADHQNIILDIYIGIKA